MNKRFEPNPSIRIIIEAPKRLHMSRKMRLEELAHIIININKINAICRMDLHLHQDQNQNQNQR